MSCVLYFMGDFVLVAGKIPRKERKGGGLLLLYPLPISMSFVCTNIVRAFATLLAAATVGVSNALE